MDSWYASDKIVELETVSVQLGYPYDAYGVITVHDGKFIFMGMLVERSLLSDVVRMSSMHC